VSGVGFDPSKRHFLRGGDLFKRTSIRPPWVSEARLLDACTRCGHCIAACEEDVLETGDGGFPVFNPRLGSGECTFCGDCAERCEAGIFDKTQPEPWAWVASIDEESCLARKNVYCSACRERCIAGAIRLTPKVGGVPLPVLLTGACTGCGACVMPCPASAVSLKQQEDEPKMYEAAE